MFQGWKVNGCYSKYNLHRSVNERREQWRQPKKWMDNVKEDMETRKFHFQRPDHHTKQNRVETSGSSLIVMLKMMEERKEGLDKSKTCCYYGL